MTDVAASDFRHPRQYVRLDTILRLRWLAVLGQLAAIFIVVQGLEFDLPVAPCVIIVGLSALLNLVLQIAFNPMRRLEPSFAASLLALNIVELAGLLFFTGGLENPFSFLFLAPVLISATALPIRLTITLGMLAVACASALVFFHLPLPFFDGQHVPVLLFAALAVHRIEAQVPAVRNLRVEPRMHRLALPLHRFLHFPVPLLRQRRNPALRKLPEEFDAGVVQAQLDDREIRMCRLQIFLEGGAVHLQLGGVELVERIAEVHQHQVAFVSEL